MPKFQENKGGNKCLTFRRTGIPTRQESTSEPFEPPHDKTNKMTHPPSLIRVFAVRKKKAWVLSYPLSAQRKLWSDWADAQADLSLRWAHTHFIGFVISWLILAKHNMLHYGIWKEVSCFFNAWLQESMTRAETELSLQTTFSKWTGGSNFIGLSSEVPQFILRF